MSWIRFTIIINILITFLLSSISAQPPVPSDEEFIQYIEKKGVTAAVELFYHTRQQNQEAQLFQERTMNQLGYKYLYAGKVAEAIDLFKLNTIAYPDAYNTYDSLGEAYMTAGNKELAIKNYGKSAELNPDNTRAAGIAYSLEHYKKTEYYIPMRDGVKLFTQVYTPKDTSQSYPFMIFRTPYSIRFYPTHNYRGNLGPNNMYAREGLYFCLPGCAGKIQV